MKTLFVMDEKNYTPSMEVVEKYSVRGVIIRNGKIAVQMGSRGDYKILGGGIDPGEDKEDALIREVQEESGLMVIPETIREIGEVIEKHRDIFEKEKTFIRHSYFYFCEVKEETTSTNMTESEIAGGYHLKWVLPEDMIKANQAFCNESWIYRDTEFLRRLFK